MISSAGIMQSQLAKSFPPELKQKFYELTNAQASLQFNRSNPFITSTLAGMKSMEHARENLQLAQIPPLSAEEFNEIVKVVA